MNAISKRFVEVLNSLSISYYAIAKEAVLIPHRLTEIRAGKREVTLGILTSFCECYKQFNADWIVTGRGSKYIDDSNKDVTPKEEKEEEKKDNQEMKYMENLILYQSEVLADQAQQKNYIEIENKIMIKKLQEKNKEIEDLNKQLAEFQ